MHPLIVHDLASEHVRDMRLTASVARRARQARRARRGHAAAGPRSSAMASDMSVRHA
jgi:hypothetical protein